MMVMDAFGEAERFTTTRGAMVLGKTPQAVSARRTKIRNILKEYGYADALHDN